MNTLTEGVDSFLAEERSNGEMGEIKSEKEEEDEWMDILGSGQLMKKVLVKGETGTRPQKLDICTISFEGKLDTGELVESADRLQVNLGDSDVVQGLDFVIALMDIGEEAEVEVGPRFAYGSLGKEPKVPPNATIRYKVKLIDVTPEPLIATLGIDERLEWGLKKKERGNWWYTRDEYTLAIHCYRRALDFLDDADLPTSQCQEKAKVLISERLKTFNNLGASQIKINSLDAALISCTNVLNCQPDNVKALFRKSKILKEKGELAESIDVVRKALAIEPENKSLQQELASQLAAQRKAATAQRDLYRKMMGADNQPPPTNKKSKNHSRLKWAAAFSVAAAIVGVIAVKYKL